MLDIKTKTSRLKYIVSCSLAHIASFLSFTKIESTEYKKIYATIVFWAIALIIAQLFDYFKIWYQYTGVPSIIGTILGFTALYCSKIYIRKQKRKEEITNDLQT